MNDQKKIHTAALPGNSGDELSLTTDTGEPPGTQGVDREALLAYSAALVAGLEALDTEYGERVFLAWEDPVTFGAGHFVFYPMEGTDSRFAIEEQYTGTDWSDHDRVATSWTWTSEIRVSEPPGCYPWQVIDAGGSAEGLVDSCPSRVSGVGIERMVNS